MDDTLRSASRLCKFIVTASSLLVAVANLCLWWTDQAYEYAVLAFFPFVVSMLLLIMVCDLLAALNGRRRWAPGLPSAFSQVDVEPRQPAPRAWSYGEAPIHYLPGATMSDFITVLRDTRPVPMLDVTKWKRIDGDPHTVNLNAYASADGSKLMDTWICMPGKWEANYGCWEFCHFLDGYYIIAPEGGQPVHLRAGDMFVIEPDLCGTWEVVETARKYFVLA